MAYADEPTDENVATEQNNGEWASNLYEENADPTQYWLGTKGKDMIIPNLTVEYMIERKKTM